MKFKNCQFEEEEYICYATLLPNENYFNYLSGEEIKKQKISKEGEIQIKMNVC